MVSFIQHIYEYLMCLSMEDEKALLDEAEALLPGFLDRKRKFDAELEAFKTGTDESEIIALMREEFILSGVLEEVRVERARQFWERSRERRRDWLSEDLKSTE